MGCRWCSSGLGELCQGPLGLDDVEVGCDCDCHKCLTVDLPIARRWVGLTRAKLTKITRATSIHKVNFVGVAEN